MKKIILTVLITINIIYANTNRITTSDGFTCESIESNKYQAEFYSESSKNDYDGLSYENGFDNSNNNQDLVGIKFTYRFGYKSKSLDCNKLYNMELQKKELELRELKAKIEALEKSAKIDWSNAQ